MWAPILYKILSESLLSLYPVFVKNINLPLLVQLWSRCISYVAIAFFFVDMDYIYNSFAKLSSGWLLSAVTVVHIYTSYVGFQELESGIGYLLFYTYPLFILLFSQTRIHATHWVAMFMALVGVWFISKTNTLYNDFNNSNFFGIAMILLAAITEAMIYFIVKGSGTTNHWNTVFVSYILGAIGLSGYYAVKGNPVKDLVLMGKNTWASLGINAFIGLAGYYLRFYSIGQMEPALYSALSYVGIVMAFVYGYIFNRDVIGFDKIVGCAFILFSQVLTKYDM